MRVKKFHGRTTQEALEQVRNSLGEEAVILSTQTLEMQDGKWYEITAATEKKKIAKAKFTSSEDRVEEAIPSSWSDWHLEWDQFKRQIYSLVKPNLDFSRLSPRQRLSLEHLEKEGVDEEIILELSSNLGNSSDNALLKELSKLVRIMRIRLDSWRQKLHALAGPHGVGKSSTILRLALKYKQNNPEHKICLVNSDLHQGKGRLMLGHYAELSDFSYFEVEEEQDWLNLFKDWKEFDKIFIDLPGLSGRSKLDKWWVESGLDNLGRVNVHLVLSPTYSRLQLSNYVSRFYITKLTSLIWTKLDEACSFGNLINIGYQTGLPVSLLSFGPGLKNSLSGATHKALWKMVFKHELPDMDS